MSEQTTPRKPLTLHRLREMPTLAQKVTQTLTIPVIGIGAMRGLQRPGAGATRHAGRQSRQTPPLCAQLHGWQRLGAMCRAVQCYVEDMKASHFPVENIHTC